MNKYLISIILILLLSSTILTKRHKNGLKKHKQHKHNFIKQNQGERQFSDADEIDVQEVVQEQQTEQDVQQIRYTEEGEYDVSISPHIEQIAPTADQNDELFAANYNFEDYYAELQSIVQADLEEVQAQLAATQQLCSEYGERIDYLEGQVVYYDNYNTYLQGKVEENLVKIEGIYGDRCEAHSIFIEYAKNVKITIRLLNFLEEAIENYSFVQLRQMNRILNKYMSTPLGSNNEVLKSMIQELQYVDEASFEVENDQDVTQRTEEQIGTGHIDNSEDGFNVEVANRQSTYLEDYKVQLKEIIDEIRTSMEASLSDRQDNEIDLNGKTSEFVLKMETDNGFMNLQIERNNETLANMRTELEQTNYFLQVCRVDEEWLVNVETSQQQIVDDVNSSEEQLRGQYDIFWSIRPDLWQLGSGKVFDLHNYDGFGLKVPQPGFGNFVINFDFDRCNFCSAGAIVTDANYQTLYSVGQNTPASADNAIQYTQSDVETSLQIQFSTISETSAAHIYIFVTVDAENTFDEVIYTEFSMVIQGEEFAQYKVRPGQLPGASQATFYFGIEFYEKLSIQNGNEQVSEWFIVPANFFVESATPRSPTQDGVASTIQGQASRPQHGSGEGTFNWNAETNRPINIRNYDVNGIKVPQTGLDQIVIGLDYDGDFEVNAGFVAVDQHYEIVSVVSVGTEQEDHNNQLFLVQNTVQYTDESDKLQLQAGLNSVGEANDAVFVVASIQGSTFNSVEKQRLSLYIGGQLFAFLIQYPSQNLNTYGTSSYIAFKFYRNPADNGSWYVQYVDQWVDLNIDGSSAQTTNSEGVRRAIRNIYWNIHYYGFGSEIIVPEWGRENVVIEFSSESSWLNFGFVAFNTETDEILSTVGGHNTSDGVYTYSDQSISFNFSEIPAEYLKTSAVVYIENESFVFTHDTSFSFRIVVAGTRIAEYTITYVDALEDQVFYIAFSVLSSGQITYDRYGFTNCPRSISGDLIKLYSTLSGNTVTGSGVLRPSVNSQNASNFPVPGDSQVFLGLDWEPTIDLDIILYVVEGVDVDSAHEVTYYQTSYKSQITQGWGNNETDESWTIDFPNLDESIDHLVGAVAIYPSSYYYDYIGSIEIKIMVGGYLYTSYTVNPSEQADASSKTCFIFGEFFRNREEGSWYYQKYNKWIGQDRSGSYARSGNSQYIRDTIFGLIGIDVTDIAQIQFDKFQFPAFVNNKMISLQYDWTPDYDLDIVLYVIRNGDATNAPYVSSSNASFNQGQITWSTGGEGVDEQFLIDYYTLDSSVTSIVVAISISEAELYFDSITDIAVDFAVNDVVFAQYTFHPHDIENAGIYTTIILGEIYLESGNWFYERFDRYIQYDQEGNEARGNGPTLRNIVERFVNIVDIEFNEKTLISTEIVKSIISIEFDWEPNTDLDIILYIVNNGDVENASYVNYSESTFNDGVVSWRGATGEVDESFYINLSQLEGTVDHLIIVVCIYSESFYSSIESMDITFLFNGIPFAEQLFFPAELEGSDDSTAIVLGEFQRYGDTWYYERLNYLIPGTDSNGSYPRTVSSYYLRQIAGFLILRQDLSEIQNFQLPSQCQDGIISLNYDWTPETNLDITLYIIRNGEIESAPVVNEYTQNYNTDQIVWGAGSEGSDFDEQFQVDFSTLDADVQHLVVVVSIYQTNYFDSIETLDIQYKWNNMIFAEVTIQPQDFENAESSTSILLGEFELEYGIWWYYRWNQLIVGTDSEGNYPRGSDSVLIRENIRTRLGYSATEITSETTEVEIPTQAFDSIVAFNYDWAPEINLDVIFFVITEGGDITTASYVDNTVQSYNEGQIDFTGAGENHKEQFLIDFGVLSEDVQQIIVVVVIYDEQFFSAIESFRYFFSYNGFIFADQTIQPSLMSGAEDSTALILGQCRKVEGHWWYYIWNRLITGSDSEGNYPRSSASLYIRQMLVLQTTTYSLNNSQSYTLPGFIADSQVRIRYDWTPDLDLDILMYIIENKEVDAAPIVNHENLSYSDGIISWGGAGDHADEKFAINFGELSESVDHLITCILVQGDAFFDSIQDISIEYTFNGIAFATQTIHPDQILEAGTYTAIILGEYARDIEGNWVYNRWNRYFTQIRDNSSSEIRQYIIQQFGYQKFDINTLENFELPDNTYSHIVSCNYDWDPVVSVDIVLYIITGGDVANAAMVNYSNTAYGDNQIQWRAQGENDADEFYIDFNSLVDSADHLVVVFCLWDTYYFDSINYISVYFNYDSFNFARETIYPSQLASASSSTALVIGQFQNHSGRWYYYRLNRMISGSDENGNYPRNGSSTMIRTFLSILLGYYRETITANLWQIPTDTVGGSITLQYDWSPDYEIDLLLYVVTNQDVYSAPYVGRASTSYDSGTIEFGLDSYDREQFDINLNNLSGTERLCLVIQVRSTSEYFNSITNMEVQFLYGGNIFANTSFSPANIQDSHRSGAMFVGEILRNGSYWFYHQYDEMIVQNDSVNRDGDATTIRQYIAQSLGWESQNINSDGGFNFSGTASGNVVTVKYDWEPYVDMDIGVYVVSGHDIYNAPYINYSQRSYDQGQIYYGSDNWDAEQFDIQLDELNSDVTQLVIVLCLYSSSYWMDYITQVETTFTYSGTVIAESMQYPAQMDNPTNCTAIIMGRIKRTSSGWRYYEIYQPIYGTNSSGTWPRHISNQLVKDAITTIPGWNE